MICILKKAHLLARVELKDDIKGAVKYQKQFKLYVLNNGEPKIAHETLAPFELDRLMGGELFELADQYFIPKDPMPDASYYRERVFAVADSMAISPDFKYHVDELCRTKAASYVLKSVSEYGDV